MKLIIIDDDPLVRASLKTILEAGGHQVPDLGSDGADAIGLYTEHIPDVLLMDIRMKTVSGIDGGRQVLEKFPDAKILFLTTFSDSEYIIAALGIGAKGYILKQDYENIGSALAAVAGGQSVFGGDIVTKLPGLLNSAQSFDYDKYDIGIREQEIIRLVADGLSNRETADMLHLSEGTVRNYISLILDKLGLRDRTQLAIFYYQHK